MLNDNDLKKIGSIVHETVSSAEKRITAHTDEKIDAAEKRITAHTDEKIDAAEKRLIETIPEKVILQVGEMIEQNVMPAIDELHLKIAHLPDKDYVDRQTAKITGAFTAQHRVTEQKLNIVFDVLRDHKLLDDTRWEEIKALSAFPAHESSR